MRFKIVKKGGLFYVFCKESDRPYYKDLGAKGLRLRYRGSDCLLGIPVFPEGYQSERPTEEDSCGMTKRELVLFFRKLGWEMK